MASKWKIGVLVEGDTDKRAIETLTRRLLGEEFDVQVVRLGSTIALHWAYSTVLTLLEDKRCQHVVLVFDAGSARRADVTQKRRTIELPLRKYHLDDDAVSVCLAVPEVEAWLLAAYEERPEADPDPKLALCGALHVPRLTEQDVEAVARSLDLAEARRRAPSFDAFATLLEGISTRLKHAPAA